MNNNKYYWISFFRNKGDEILYSLSSNFDKRQASRLINNNISLDRDFEIDNVINLAYKEKWTREQLLNEILYITLMNPLMILVKIIKLRWIHILSYDQMVSPKINNQTTKCANSIFYTTLFTNSAPNYT
ncbi:hypothetical protein, partial [Pasteurella multocida]|uniref:hypothetical protein n=4 Tax=Pasteurella multocida TaxID=747 RepID=UPI0003D8E4E9